MKHHTTLPLLLLPLVALLGAGSYIVYHQFTRPPAEPVVEAPMSPAEDGAGTVVELSGAVLSKADSAAAKPAS